MKSSTILTLLLIGSLCLNFYFWKQKEPVALDCVVTPGFAPPSTISSEEVGRYVGEYKASLNEPDTITGGIITRTALQEIMCIKDCNAITYEFALDQSGGIGPGEHNVFLILSGANVVYDEETKSITSVNNIGASYYYTTHWCPPTCMVW